MNINTQFRRLKPYKRMVLFSLALSIILGLAMFLLKQGKTLIVISTLIPLLSTLFQILFLEREFATLLSVSLILLSIIYYTSFTFFKKSLVAIRNLQKSRASSYNVFIVLLGIVSFVTILGLQYSMIVKYKIDKKKGRQGLQGKVGSRGNRGDIAINEQNELTILQQSMEKYSQQIFLVGLRQRYPDNKWSENTDYFKNISMKQAIPNAINSWGFRSIMLELRKNYMNEAVDGNETCDTDKATRDKIIKALEQMMKTEINTWIEIFSQYENGFLFLQTPLSLETDWETLYSKQDKDNKLPSSPYTILRKREIWLWNELTREEYMKKAHSVKIVCDTLNNNCEATRLLNKDVIYYPTIFKNENNNYEIKINN